jgi:DNA invertase Pin-like site-specific DNA recombinase
VTIQTAQRHKLAKSYRYHGSSLSHRPPHSRHTQGQNRGKNNYGAIEIEPSHPAWAIIHPGSKASPWRPSAESGRSARIGFALAAFVDCAANLITRSRSSQGRHGPATNSANHWAASSRLRARRNRAVLYLRVSTQDQTTKNQEVELHAIAERMGVEVTKVYKDHGISGAKSRDERPAFDAMCNAATRREFNMVMAWSVDRLGRSLQDLIAFLSELHALKVDLYLHTQGINTTTPAGKAMFQMMGVFAEFERAMIRERVNAGLKRARAQGRVGGRPRIDAGLEAQIKESPGGARQARRESDRREAWHRGGHRAESIGPDFHSPDGGAPRRGVNRRAPAPSRKWR